jgi:hypothetical protein
VCFDFSNNHQIIDHLIIEKVTQHFTSDRISHNHSQSPHKFHHSIISVQVIMSFTMLVFNFCNVLALPHRPPIRIRQSELPTPPDAQSPPPKLNREVGRERRPAKTEEKADHPFALSDGDGQREVRNGELGNQGNGGKWSSRPTADSRF